MKAQIIRIRPDRRFSSDRVNRLFIPTKKLIIAPGFQVTRGTISGDVLVEGEVDVEVVRFAERILENQENLKRKLQSRSHKKLFEMLSV